MTENRQGRRSPAAFMAAYRVLEPIEARAEFGEEEKDALAEDLSVGGVSLSVGDPVALGAMVSVRFRAIRQGPADREEGSRKFELRGQVRHCSPAGQTKSFRVGVQFGKLSEGERRFIELIGPRPQDRL